jgi:hypothetical protein
MTDDDAIYENLPEDPEQAFLVLEEHFREKCLKATSQSSGDEDSSAFWLEYIGDVLASLQALKLQVDFFEHFNAILHERPTYVTYIDFTLHVKRLCTMLRVKNGRRVQGYSVRFDTPAKMKVQHHIKQLRGIFGKLEVERRKKDALLEKLNELQKEVDRDRTRFDAFGALVIEVAGVMGDAVEKSKVLDVLDAIAGVIWGSKREGTKQLPAPPTKRIEPPRASDPNHKGEGDMDDEVPF